MSGAVIIQMVKSIELSGEPGRSWPDGTKTFLQWDGQTAPSPSLFYRTAENPEINNKKIWHV